MDKIVIKKTNRCDTRTLAPGQVVTEQDAETDTKYHIAAVQKCAFALLNLLVEQVKWHDHTKLDNLKEFTTGLNKGVDSTEFNAWYENHVNSERHHLLKRCPDDVNLVDVIEMLCDCVSAGLARTGKVFDVEIPADILTKAVKNTVELLINNIEVKD